MRFTTILIVMILGSLLKAQVPFMLNQDTLEESLTTLLEERTPAFKKKHFLTNLEYDYYGVINSPRIVYELNNVFHKITLPSEITAVQGISFVKCYSWVDAYSTWFVTIIDDQNNHYLYFYENNRGIDRIDLHSVATNKNYVLRLGQNLLTSHLSCGEKNEDYIVIAEIVGNSFVSFTSSQIFHRMDMIFFHDLLDALQN